MRAHTFSSSFAVASACRTTRFLILALPLTTAALYAQSTQQALSELLLHKKLALRGVWRDDDLRFDSTGHLSKASEIGNPMLAIVNITKVDLKKDRLVLTGNRLAVHFEDQALVSANLDRRVRVEVATSNDGNYEPALKLIFATSLADLAPALPDYWKGCVVPEATTAPQPSVRPKTSSPVKAPVIVYATPIEFPEVVKGPGSGEALVSLEVNNCGIPTHVHLLKGVSQDFDRIAVQAVKGYRFQPAMQDGIPISVEMNVAVDSQVH